MTMTLPAATGVNLRPKISMEKIISVMRQRRSQDSILIRGMIEVRDRYNGDVVIPLPDVDKSPTMDVPSPRLIAMAIDSGAMRAASPQPTISCPVLNPARKGSIKDSQMRRKMLYSKWFDNQLDIKLYRMYRHLRGYGTCALMVLPDNETQKAKIELRDPLTSYPELRDPSDIRDPKNVGFVYGRSIDWITSKWPDSTQFFVGAAEKEWDTLWDVVEWIDEWEIVIGVLGPRMPAYSPQDARPYGFGGFELARYENKAGMVPVCMPRRLTLDRVMGQMSTMIDTVDLHGRMTALEVIAAEKHIFPDMVMMGADNQSPEVVSGSWKDGRTGEVNIVTGARGVEYLTTQIPAFVPAIVEQLEDAIRQSGGASSISSGDNPGGLRTGRALDVMGSFSIDPAVEEIQKIGQKCLSTVNEACIAVEQGYYPSKTHFCFTGLQGDDAVLEYKPSDIDSKHNVVTYPIPGADISQMSVAIAQLQGSGLISKHTARVKHPFIDDAMQEEKVINIEQVEGAIFAGFGQQVSQGQVPLPDAVRVLELLRAGGNMEDAINTAQKESQARQAAQAPPPQEGQATDPSQQPGLASPGMGVEAAPPGGPSIPPPAMALQNFHGITRNLNAAPPTAPTGGPPGA